MKYTSTHYKNYFCVINIHDFLKPLFFIIDPVTVTVALFKLSIHQIHG